MSSPCGRTAQTSCPRPDSDRPMCYRGESWCSEKCRKEATGEA